MVLKPYTRQTLLGWSAHRRFNSLLDFHLSLRSPAMYSISRLNTLMHPGRDLKRNSGPSGLFRVEQTTHPLLESTCLQKKAGAWRGPFAAHILPPVAMFEPFR